MKIFIYKQDLTIKERLNNSLEDFKKNPLQHYPNWEEGYLVSEKEYLDPRFIKIKNGEIAEKTPVELKLEGLEDLEDGEYIIFGKLEKIEKPSEFRVWNKSTNTWDIDNELIAYHINNMYDDLGTIRDGKLSDGTLFENEKLIRGRTQDLSDAQASYMMATGGALVDWFYSDGKHEEKIGAERMLAIFSAIGIFRTSQFTREKEVAHYITQVLTIEEAETFDTSLYW